MMSSYLWRDVKTEVRQMRRDAFPIIGLLFFL